MVSEATKDEKVFVIVKSMPLWLSRLLINTGLLQWWFNTKRYVERTMNDVVDVSPHSSCGFACDPLKNS